MCNSHVRTITMTRRYTANSRDDAAAIAAECVRSRKSTGWAGDIEHREAVEEILRPFNISYVDDMRGEWAVR
jgi:hypothetical protein